MYKFGDILLITQTIDYRKVGIQLPRHGSRTLKPTNYDFPNTGDIIMINGHNSGFRYPDNFGSYAMVEGFPCLNSKLESRFLPIDENGKSRFCNVSLLDLESTCEKEEYKLFEKIRESISK